MKTLKYIGSGRTQNTMLAYESVSEMVSKMNPAKYVGAQYGYSDPQWSGTAALNTWEKILEACQKPDEKCLEVLKNLMKRLGELPMPELKSHLRKRRYSMDDGNEVDLDRMRSGQEYWQTSARESSTGPTTVTIVTDITAMAARTPEEIFYRGAAALTLASMLEAKGYTVALYAVEGDYFRDGAYQHKPMINAVCLKEAGAPFDVSTLVNTLSGWFYRLGVFTLLYTLNAQISVYRPNAVDLDQLTPDVNRIYVYGIFSFAEAASLVESALKKIGEANDRV